MGTRIAVIFAILCTAFCIPLFAQTEPSTANDPIAERLDALQSYEAELERERSELAEQYVVLSGNPLLHRVLQEHRAGIRQIDTTDMEAQLAQLRLQHFHLQRQLRQTGVVEESAQQELDTLSQQINTLVEFMSTQQRMALNVRQFEQQLDEYLFWTPSHPSMNLNWWRTWIPNAYNQIGRITETAGETLRNARVQLDIWSVALAVLFVGLLLKRTSLRSQLEVCQARLRDHAQTPSPWLIPRAVILTALYVMPLSLAILLAGQFINAPGGSSIDIGPALMALALAWFMLSFFRRLLMPQGLGESGFNWQADQCRVVRRFVVLLAWVLLPVSFILAIAAQQRAGISDDVVGSVVLLFAGLYLTGLVIYLFRTLSNFYGSGTVHNLIGVAVLCLPLTLIFMVVTGYYYTALTLSGYYLATFYIISVWVIVQSGVDRAISISAEYLHMRRDESSAIPLELAEHGEEQANPLQDKVDPEEAKNQSLRLARFIVFLGFGFILYAVWSDALIALDYLNTQVLWQRETETGFMPISIGSFMSAAFIALFSIILVRNLPGLLEILILSRLRLEMGTAYAVTSLVKYIVVSIAVVSFLATLGVSWNNLQWLAAGLTVGLGFGLQEIFGNFISGLILFFERPVRVGDIVTLNNLSGRVNQIRIRATVITDFDRRDIVVPNRSFITGQFVNWSLSNTVTRIIVKVGVAYGSDLDKTREILLDIAAQNERVLDDPEPQALFLSFGESTLDHELRMHVGSLKERNPTIDEINRAIEKRFNEAGIEIAFRQLDVHFRTSDGLERLVQQHKPG